MTAGRSLYGPTAVAFSNDDVVAPAKIIDEFAKDAKALEIKGGVIEGKSFFSGTNYCVGKTTKPRGLLSMLYLLQAPVRGLRCQSVAEKTKSCLIAV